MARHLNQPSNAYVSLGGYPSWGGLKGTPKHKPHFQDTPHEHTTTQRPNVPERYTLLQASCRGPVGHGIWRERFLGVPACPEMFLKSGSMLGHSEDTGEVTPTKSRGHKSGMLRKVTQRTQDLSLRPRNQNSTSFLASNKYRLPLRGMPNISRRTEMFFRKRYIPEK